MREPRFSLYLLLQRCECHYAPVAVGSIHWWPNRSRARSRSCAIIPYIGPGRGPFPDRATWHLTGLEAPLLTSAFCRARTAEQQCHGARLYGSSTGVSPSRCQALSLDVALVPVGCARDPLRVAIGRHGSSLPRLEFEFVLSERKRPAGRMLSSCSPGEATKWTVRVVFESELADRPVRSVCSSSPPQTDAPPSRSPGSAQRAGSVPFATSSKDPGNAPAEPSEAGRGKILLSGREQAPRQPGSPYCAVSPARPRRSRRNRRHHARPVGRQQG